MRALTIALILNLLACVGWLFLVPAGAVSLTCAIVHALVAGWIVCQILIGDEDL